jgi:glycosyltransferase involved in cell wall biosynthesis
MRIGLVGPLPPPFGGMANQTRQLGHLLEAEGIRTLLVRTNEPYRPAWMGRVRGIRALFRFAPYLRALAAMSRQVDVVHVMANSGWAWSLFAVPAIRVAAARGAAVVVNYRGGLAREFLAKSARRVRSTLKRADAIVVPSRFLQHVFAEHDIATHIIPNVVDLEMFRPDECRTDASGPRMLVARNLEPIYGIDTALKAIAILRRQFPDLTVWIAGSGPEREPLLRLCSQLGVADAVQFTGRLEVQAIAELYRRADVVLNPSRADNTPNSLLEAAASGVPIVSTNVGGVPYLVEHERTAWLVPPDRPDLMAAGVARVLEDAVLRHTLRANALALAASCGWSAVRTQWLDLYERLAHKRGGSIVAAPGKM